MPSLWMTRSTLSPTETVARSSRWCAVVAARSVRSRRELGLSQQVVSHHLKVLREAGLVSGTREGTRHLYAVRVEGLAVGKAFFDDFWPERLTRLKHTIENAGAADG